MALLLLRAGRATFVVSLFVLLVPVLAVAAGKPDLTVASASAPTTATAGGSLKVTIVLRNIGSSAARPSKTSVHLVYSNVGTGIALGNSSAVALAAHGTRTLTGTFKIPASTPAMSYYIQVCADANKTVREANEHNNCFIGRGKVRVNSAGT